MPIVKPKNEEGGLDDWMFKTLDHSKEGGKQK